MKNSLKPYSEGTMGIPHPLRLFLLASIVLTIVSFAYTLVCRSVGLGLPYSFPFYYVPDNMFTDLTGLQEKFDTYGTPEFFTDKEGFFMYPAPLVHVYRFLLTIPGHVMRRYGILAGISILVLCVILLQAFRRNGMNRRDAILTVFSMAVLSYPLSFLLQRSNVEVLVWVLTSVAIWQFVTDRPRTAAIFIGIAASLKLYPIILLGLFLPRRRYAAIGLSLLVFFAVTLISLYAIGPTIGAAYAWNSVQIREFSKHYAGNLWALGYDHSFFSLVKFFTIPWHPDVDPWVRIYTVIAGTASLVIYFARIWRIPLVNQILALSVLNVMLAPISYDYTLLNLYAAFALLVIVFLRAEQGRAPSVPFASPYALLFALVFTPESYIIIHGIRYGAQVRALCLIAILVLALTRPIYSSWDEEMRSSKEEFAGVSDLTESESSATLPKIPVSWRNRVQER